VVHYCCRQATTKNDGVNRWAGIPHFLAQPQTKLRQSTPEFRRRSEDSMLADSTMSDTVPAPLQTTPTNALSPVTSHPTNMPEVIEEDSALDDLHVHAPSGVAQEGDVMQLFPILHRNGPVIRDTIYPNNFPHLLSTLSKGFFFELVLICQTKSSAHMPSPSSVTRILRAAATVCRF
jgi:hypothetical protein